MASRISIATGNFTAAGTWGLVDASSTTGSSYLDSQSGTSTPAVATNSASFLWAVTAPTIDGIAVKIASSSSALGTITLNLRNVDAGSNVKTVIINVSDLNNAGQVGWYFFKFDAAIALTAATNYAVRLVSSSANVTFYTDGAASFSHMLRTTTTGAPAANDQLHVIGEFTAAATLTSFVVTMNETVTTSYGPTVSGGPPQGITVGKGGTWTNGAAAATNYYFKWKGTFAIYGGGVVNLNSAGSRLPATSTSKYEMDSVANVDTGFDAFPGGTLNAGGAVKTTVATLMTADKAAAATVIALAATTDWAVSDVLAFASTTRTASQCENKTVLTVDSSTQVTLTAGLTNAHSGTSPTQAEVINLTRNVKIFGTSTSLQGYLRFQTTATVAMSYVEFYNLGSATAGKRGIDNAITTGSCSITFCSIHDFIVVGSIGFNHTAATGSGLTFSNNVGYNTNDIMLSIVQGSTWTVDSNVLMLTVAAFKDIIQVLGSIYGTLTNNTMVGAAYCGLRMSLSGDGTAAVSISGNTMHSNAQYGLFSDFNQRNQTFTNTTIWRNNAGGLNLVLNGGITVDWTFNTITLFGNNTSNIALGWDSNLVFNSATISGDTTFATATGVLFAGAQPIHDRLQFNSCTFGVVSGIKTAHTQDFSIVVTGGLLLHGSIYLNNCLLASATEFAGIANIGSSLEIRSEKHDQTAGLHKTWRKYGIIAIETGTVHTGSQAFSMTPNNATNKLVSGSFYAAVANGATVTPTVFINKSAAYNGNQPRLIVKRNDAVGISADTVLATYSAGTGSWNSISGATAAATDDGVMEFVVDCDGTAGIAYVDSLAVA